MFDVIREFLLTPALLTTGLFLVAALLTDVLISRLADPSARRFGWWRHLLFVVCGELGTLLSILIFFSLSVVKGIEGLRYVAWGGVILAWWLSSLLLSRPSKTTAITSAALGAIAFLVDTQITETILFE